MKTWTLLAATAATVTLLAIGISRSYSDDAKTAWVAPEADAKKANPVAADAESLAAGKKLYDTNCAMCHGDTGKGDGRAAAMFKPAPPDLSAAAITGQSDGSLYWKITTGKTPMAGYKDILTEKERWSVVNYLRKLAPPPATQPSK